MPSVIIPVKTLSRAKSRLDLPAGTRERLCAMMLEEVLHTVSACGSVDSVIVVSRDRRVLEMAERSGATGIRDTAESGVNDAVALADAYLEGHTSDASIVIPQDVPFIKTQDMDFLLRFRTPPPCVLVVPSRKFDGTNALLRTPTGLMRTHYDEDSYKIHLETGRRAGSASLVFIRRIMMDIDDGADLRYCLAQNEKPDLCARIRDLLGTPAGNLQSL